MTDTPWGPIRTMPGMEELLAPEPQPDPLLARLAALEAAQARLEGALVVVRLTLQALEPGR